MIDLNTHKRQEQILGRLRESGMVQVRELVERLGVSEMTIRRDLELLAAQGHLVSTYGGAMPASVLSRAVLLSDSSKFGRRSTFQICPLTELSQIIIDANLPAEMAASIRQGGVRLDLV